jgi:hypothetical protein
MAAMQELSGREMANRSTEPLIGILSNDFIILPTLPLIWLRQQTECSLLGRGKSITFSSTA